MYRGYVLVRPTASGISCWYAAWIPCLSFFFLFLSLFLLFLLLLSLSCSPSFRPAVLFVPCIYFTHRRIPPRVSPFKWPREGRFTSGDITRSILHLCEIVCLLERFLRRRYKEMSSRRFFVEIRQYVKKIIIEIYVGYIKKRTNELLFY